MYGQTPPPTIPSVSLDLPTSAVAVDSATQLALYEQSLFQASRRICYLVKELHSVCASRDCLQQSLDERLKVISCQQAVLIQLHAQNDALIKERLLLMSSLDTLSQKLRSPSSDLPVVSITK